jgi:predicted nucleic acid-binding protein
VRRQTSALFRYELLAPLILPEATSDQIAAFVRRLTAEEFAASHWTRVEFFSLIGREVRMGTLDAQAAVRADARFEAMVDESFSILLPTADDFILAKRYLGRFETGLRAGDALHLAVANNHRAAAIYSLDKTLLKARKPLDLPVSLGIRSKRSRRR